MTYSCNECWHIKHISFTCKSRFCNSCWKPLSDLRTNKLFSWRPTNLQYFHFSFTIPQELREFFHKHRKALSVLSSTAASSIFYFFSTKYKCTPWMLSVIHTFGAQLNRNPHVHILLSAGWITKNWSFKHVSFIPFLWFLASWKLYLIKNLKDWCDSNLSWDLLIQKKHFLNSFFNQKDSNGNDKFWYIHFSKKADSFQVILSYIGRYLKRPVIAQSRIIDYDSNNVTFSYKDKYDNITKQKTLSALEFIWLLLQHIPNKFFKMVNYYGIFANRCKAKYLKLINTFFNNSSKLPYIPTNFKDRIVFHWGKDPLACSCWWFYILYQIIIPGYPPKYFDSS